MIEQIVMAIVVSAAYALLGYAKSVGEGLDVVKAVATIGLGSLIGIVLYNVGTPITEVTVMELMAAHAGLLYMFENGIKAIWRRIKPLFPSNKL